MMDEKNQTTTPNPLLESGKADQGKSGENDKKQPRRAYREAVEKRAAAERAAISSGTGGGKADRNTGARGGNRKGEAEAETESSPAVYFLDPDGYLCRMKSYRDAEIKIRLANFSARITEENHVDDGAERAIFYSIEGSIKRNQILPKIEVPAAQFQGMSWPHKWGSRGKDRGRFPGHLQAMEGSRDPLKRDQKGKESWTAMR